MVVSNVMRSLVLLGAGSLLASTLGCTQPNPAFGLGERGTTRATADDAADGDEKPTTSTHAETATQTETSDSHGTSEGSDTRSTSDVTGPSDTGDTAADEGCTIGSCAPHEYCSFPEASRCGFDQTRGECKPRPERCDPTREPVVACDCTVPYDNPCRARLAGFDVLCEAEADGCRC